MTNAQRREWLFNLYAANLSALPRFWQIEQVYDTFVCPFCRRRFGREALINQPQLALAHTVPDELGGSDGTCTLVCAKCDNTAGSILDAHLMNRLEAEEFVAGIGNERRTGQVEIDGAKV